MNLQVYMSFVFCTWTFVSSGPLCSLCYNFQRGSMISLEHLGYPATALQIIKRPNG